MPRFVNKFTHMKNIRRHGSTSFMASISFSHFHDVRLFFKVFFMQREHSALYYIFGKFQEMLLN